MAKDQLGNNLDTTIREHILALQHKMKQVDMDAIYSAYYASSAPIEDLGTGYEELVDYENKLGDDIGNQTR